MEKNEKYLLFKLKDPCPGTQEYDDHGQIYQVMFITELEENKNMYSIYKGRGDSRFYCVGSIMAKGHWEALRTYLESEEEESSIGSRYFLSEW
jgi:hypothetical protein